MNPRLYARKTLRFIVDPAAADAPTGAGAPADDQAEAPSGTPADAEGEDPAGEPGQNEDELPDWARSELTRVRGEAAKYRTAAREARDALSKAKTPEEVEAATSELVKQNAELEQTIVRDRVARKHGLPDELAARLVGSTEEELTADAAKLALLVTPAAPAPDPSGGLDPRKGTTGEFDPVAVARAARARRR